jgi:transcriptional regulator with PAS, ATPase and Fis domain
MVDYIGECPEWKRIDAMVDKAAAVSASVLLLGETGTGKEVVARALHRRSGRSGDFVAVNCGALPRDLLATELFGYVGGAFTGARESGAAGKFEAADGGTLFLDEIGELPYDMQVTLLRSLQEQSVTRVGSNQPKAIDVRVIAATNQDIKHLIEIKQFRSDLYYRLSLMEFHLPPLRNRKDDIDLLVDYFNKLLSDMLGVEYTALSAQTLEALRAYSWPGNVRELRNLIERCLIMEGTGARILPSTLPQHIANALGDQGFADVFGAGGEVPAAQAASQDGAATTGTRGASLPKTKAEAAGLLRRYQGDLEAAAAALDMTPADFYHHLRALGASLNISL